MSKNTLQPLSRLALAVFRANQALLEDGDVLAGGWRLTSARWKVLGAVVLGGAPVTVPAVARLMGLTRQGAQKQLNGLLRDGLVAREENPGDARAPLYQITPKGSRVYGEITSAWNARSERVTRGIDDAALHAAAETLTRVAVAISADPQPPAGARRRSSRR